MNISLECSVTLRDFRPNATTKWQQAKVIRQTGSLTYEVNVDGQIQAAHIDHLKPWPVDSVTIPEQPSPDTPAEEPPVTPQSASSSIASFLIPATEDADHESEQDTHSTTNRPERSRRPPRRLIEEIT